MPICKYVGRLVDYLVQLAPSPTRPLGRKNGAWTRGTSLKDATLLVASSGRNPITRFIAFSWKCFLFSPASRGRAQQTEQVSRPTRIQNFRARGRHSRARALDGVRSRPVRVDRRRSLESAATSSGGTCHFNLKGRPMTETEKRKRPTVSARVTCAVT